MQNKVHTGILGGLWSELLGRLSVFLPPPEPAAWCMHDKALYVHVDFCSRSHWGSRRPRSSSSSSLSVAAPRSTLKRARPRRLSGNANARLLRTLRHHASLPEVSRQNGEFSPALYALGSFLVIMSKRRQSCATCSSTCPASYKSAVDGRGLM